MIKRPCYGMILACAIAAPVTICVSTAFASDLALGKVGTEAQLGAIKPLCGTKPIKVALADGWGGNLWRKVVRAEFEAEAKKCPNITQVAYTDARGNPQQQIQDIRSLTAQGFNVILVSFDFVQSNLRAMEEARKAGVAVVLYYTGTKVPAEPDKHYVALVTPDQPEMGRLNGEWIVKYLHGKGTVLPYGGTPGAQPIISFMSGWKPVLDKHADIRVLEDPLVTNWDLAEYTKVTTAMLGKYTEIGALESDWTPGMMAAVRAFQAVGRTLPGVTGADSNEIACFWEDNKAQNPTFQYSSVSGYNWISRVALRKGVAYAEGLDDTEPSVIESTLVRDSLSDDPALTPKCDRTLAPDASLVSTHLSADEIRALVAK
jgi:ribose transport system substrate-binding protein